MQLLAATAVLVADSSAACSVDEAAVATLVAVLPLIAVVQQLLLQQLLLIAVATLVVAMDVDLAATTAAVQLQFAT